jgi:hypothetical protein
MSQLSLTDLPVTEAVASRKGGQGNGVKLFA